MPSSKDIQYARLGKSGLKVSRIAVGCAGFGSKKNLDWMIEEEDTLSMTKKCYDAGLNFFDTADSYTNGVSGQILGKAIKQYNLPRENLVIATKCFGAQIEQEEPTTLCF
ncbi:hypothetical protein BZG36_05223 [Bifiguratus adelaidae]|uniref:NADP-dependent oxidoreductase domain-containing protein n=1 Tax=Bifiguratus adelaidae TaxID=1938954 RepID=A0A261XX42_9FUNG|nr:hypothetical protein BZG36_05223 [Bifiguratus adelaidae]